MLPLIHNVRSTRRKDLRFSSAMSGKDGSKELSPLLNLPWIGGWTPFLSIVSPSIICAAERLHYIRGTSAVGLRGIEEGPCIPRSIDTPSLPVPRSPIPRPSCVCFQGPSRPGIVGIFHDRLQERCETMHLNRRLCQGSPQYFSLLYRVDCKG